MKHKNYNPRDPNYQVRNRYILARSKRAQIVWDEAPQNPALRTCGAAYPNKAYDPHPHRVLSGLLGRP